MQKLLIPYRVPSLYTTVLDVSKENALNKDTRVVVFNLAVELRNDLSNRITHQFSETVRLVQIALRLPLPDGLRPSRSEITWKVSK